MDDTQLLRYSRHILLSELGVDAQQRFAEAHALIVGVGGLGNPVAQFLAGAGVGSRRRDPTRGWGRPQWGPALAAEVEVGVVGRSTGGT